MNQSLLPHQAAKKIKDIAPSFNAKVGIILGSGLGPMTNQLNNKLVIPYFDLPGFPDIQVKGHPGNLILGYLNETPVICLQGRSHRYEENHYDAVKVYIRTLKLLGCQTLLATNASGSLREDIAPGELVLVTDHINFQGSNPLIGPNDDEFGPRFPPLDNAYCQHLQNIFNQSADELNIHLHHGIYISVTGPSYETVAEIKAFKLLGADVIGMSTVPEVIVANHCGLKVAVIATITNFATGLAKESHCHDNVVDVANKSSHKLQKLVTHAISQL